MPFIHQSKESALLVFLLSLRVCKGIQQGALITSGCATKFSGRRLSYVLVWHWSQYSTPQPHPTPKPRHPSLVD
eukprot:3166138-Amphidinium_carterae.1